MASVFARVLSGMGPNELQRANHHYPLPKGGHLTVIAPTVEVLGGFEVEAGLINMHFDYGWLRAAEATAEMNDYDRVHLGQLSDQIATHRERTWFLQERVLQSGNRLDYAGALRHARAITAIAASEWMSTGLDPRPGMEFWGYGWEEDRTAIPAELSAVGKIG